MTEATPDRVTLRDVYDLVAEVRVEMARRIDATDTKVDHALSRLDHMEGAIGMVRWIGPAGIALLIVGFLRAYGVM